MVTMSETKRRAVLRRYQVARGIQLVLCIVFLLWIQTVGTYTSVAQPPSLDVLNERISRLNEANTETKRLMLEMVKTQQATERRVDTLYTVGSTLMGIIVVIEGYVAITGRKLRSQPERSAD